jgi:hypothetical protein
MVTKGLKMWNSWELVKLCQECIFHGNFVFFVFFFLFWNKVERSDWNKGSKSRYYIHDIEWTAQPH